MERGGRREGERGRTTGLTNFSAHVAVQNGHQHGMERGQPVGKQSWRDASLQQHLSEAGVHVLGVGGGREGGREGEEGREGEGIREGGEYGCLIPHHCGCSQSTSAPAACKWTEYSTRSICRNKTEHIQFHYPLGPLSRPPPLRLVCSPVDDSL